MAYEGMTGPGLSSSGSGSGGKDVKVSFTRGSIKYDTPFLDMTSTFIPTKIKSLLRFVAAYVVGDGLVAQCITKMSEYPITKLLYKEDEESALDKDKSIDYWKKILEEKLKVVASMKQAGMDYYAYGNAIISINYPFKRMLKCKRCKKEHTAESMNIKFRDYKFFSECPEPGCGYRGEFDARDINTREIDKLGIVHWDLLYMEIKYNSITGDHFYYYTIPQYLSMHIKRGDMDIVNCTRLEIIEAVKKRKQLKLMADNIFHLKRSAPQYLYPSERGWGIPVVMPVMKNIFHCQILKKGNEMIAFDHIVPLRILFPQSTGDVSPHATINLSSWKTKIEDELRKWRADPNYVSIVPIPLGITNFSGDAKILTVTPEIKATQDEIITGIGIIPEIIRGGASWSGSNVSLRVVENTFLNHRNDIHAMLEFIVENVSRYMGKPAVKVKMSDFKMADDLDKKRLMIQAAMTAASEALVSRTTATKELGFDPKEEFSLLMEELSDRIELRVKEAEGSAEAQGSALVVNSMYQADAELEHKSRTEMREREDMAQRDDIRAKELDERTYGVADEVDAVSQQKGTADTSQMSLPNLILVLTNRFARLATIDKEEFKIRMLTMKNSMPNLYSVIYNNLKEMNLIEADLLPNLEEVQKYTPGQVPSYTQGETHAEEPPAPSEYGADPRAISPGGTGQGYNKPLPEARPPVSPNAPI